MEGQKKNEYAGLDMKMFVVADDRELMPILCKPKLIAVKSALVRQLEDRENKLLLQEKVKEWYAENIKYQTSIISSLSFLRPSSLDVVWCYSLSNYSSKVYPSKIYWTVLLRRRILFSFITFAIYSSSFVGWYRTSSGLYLL